MFILCIPSGSGYSSAIFYALSLLSSYLALQVEVAGASGQVRWGQVAQAWFHPPPQDQQSSIPLEVVCFVAEEIRVQRGPTHSLKFAGLGDRGQQIEFGSVYLHYWCSLSCALVTTCEWACSTTTPKVRMIAELAVMGQSVAFQLQHFTSPDRICVFQKRGNFCINYTTPFNLQKYIQKIIKRG